MSMVSDILEELWNSELKYKGIKINIFGVPKFSKYNHKSMCDTLGQLKRKGLIEKELSGLVLSKRGKEYVRKKFDSLKQFDKPSNSSKGKNLLVMFDVPTERKREREWLRWHLKKFEYIMIQQSVWVGPDPLPKEFTEYLKRIKLDRCIKTFKLEKEYKI